MANRSSAEKTSKIDLSIKPQRAAQAPSAESTKEARVVVVTMA